MTGIQLRLASKVSYVILGIVSLSLILQVIVSGEQILEALGDLTRVSAQDAMNIGSLSVSLAILGLIVWEDFGHPFFCVRRQVSMRTIQNLEIAY